MGYFLILVLTPSAIVLSRLVKHKAALPVLTTISVYFAFLLEVQISLMNGMLLLVFWTAFQSILILYFSIRNPREMAELIWKAEPYTESMFQWIDSGDLPEGSNRKVVLFHLKQAILFCIAALISANLLSILLGSALLNYMNYYVAQLALHTRNRLAATILGWNPWSVVRVIGFLYLGIVFGAPLLSQMFPLTFSLSVETLIPGLAAVILDVVMKILLAPLWSARLKRALNIAKAEDFAI